MSSGSHRTDTALAIESRGLTKSYGDTVAVDDLSLSVDRGVIYGFLGPNGSGKTTTMRMLTSLTTPTSGEAAVAGTPVTDRETLISDIGYLPDTPPVFEELTGRENLSYFASLHDVPSAVAAERIDRYLERFDLVDAADRRVDGYSKGMQQKLGLIQAVIHDPSVIFLDEPTSGLDPRAARTVKDLIAELADREVTIFLSTHILSVVDELADRVGVIHDGSLIAEGSPADLKRRAERDEATTLEAAFLNLTESHTEADA